MAFEIETFRNPYNGKPRNGFTVITMDADGGLIDSSVVGEIDINLIVTEWAALTLVNIMRYEITEASMIANDITISTTIREESAGKVEIIMDLPVDPHCRIEVKFPSDMPLTADFKYVSSEGILQSPKVAPPSIDLTTRSFYLEGCSNYNSKIYNVLSIFNMRNKDKVRKTESFAVYLWALDPAQPDQAYVIAKNESAIRLEEKDFSMGSMVSLFVTPVDTYVIQRHTRFLIEFKTVDPIPWNSKIKVRFPTTITLVSGACKLESGSFPFNEAAHCMVD
jgi:hypothetical protein